MSIAAKNLTKIYGQQRALDAISFTLKEGEIVGFLGPNGAGKSTTMKIATGYIPPTSGSLEVCGFEVTDHPRSVKSRVGYLPEHNPLYLDMYVHEYLAFIGSLHGLGGSYLQQRKQHVVSLFGLAKEQNKKIGALSKGYRQRVGLAQALIHDPQVLILDEPTTGLDPNQIVEIRALIKEVSHSKTVLFSTHIMQEVQALCQRVIILDNGKIAADRAVEELQTSNEKNSGSTILVNFDHKVSPEDLLKISGVVEIKKNPNGGYLLLTESKADIRPIIFNHIVAQKWTLVEMQLITESLEAIFQDITGKGGGND